MRADVAAPLVEAHRDVEPSVLAHDAPRTQTAASPIARGASVERHAAAGQEPGLRMVTALRLYRALIVAGYPLTDRRQFGILRCGPRSARGIACNSITIGASSYR
jgi:hypothetical protein